MKVSELQAVLEREQGLNRFLRLAMHEPLVVSHSFCHSCLSSVIPVQVLLAELAIVEEEIICLERRVEDLKLCLIQERKQQKNYVCCLGRTSHDLVTIPSEQVEEKSISTPNKISEELIKSLISIFHKFHRPGNRLDCEITSVPKLTISCINSRSFISCKSDPMQALDIDGMMRNIGFYKNCIQLTRNSFDPNHIYLCVADIARVQILIEKLRDVELNCLTYKQKLAFWINIYNASIMHAFLQHGLPQTSEKLLTLLNKAAVNVGGIVLNALAIEHFILRNSSMNGKDAKLWRKYGLGYPEPNVTFALCRGNWSSPALRVYTAEDVVNELESAKVEYLEASICITNKKKIFMPKLLHWHIKDFADDIVSLLEWIYSQLPRSASLKCLVMECLNGNTKASLIKSVEIQPYDAEFRYLLPC
ncbi:putative ternary complex factor MIP1, leucine-zipper [Dioscorea sansibarensis]